MGKITAGIRAAGAAAKGVFSGFYRRLRPFPGSEAYWIQRYDRGGDSGAGSHDELAEFKAEVVNAFVREEVIETVIEFGCGDGNQLRLAKYPSYIGYEISTRALELCRDTFRSDRTKIFRHMSEYAGETSQLALSLDVIYHLVEDEVYSEYMKRLFDASERYVIIYSSDFDAAQNFHERRRKFTNWIDENRANWKLIRHIPNRYPYNRQDGRGSLSEFFIYEKD